MAEQGPAQRASSPATITRLLNRWNEGDEEAAARLMPKIYDELHRIAVGYFQAERSDHTLQPTAILHEAYLRLGRTRVGHWQSRTHFYGIAARSMRHVLVDHGRHRARQKRGGQVPRLSLAETGELPAPVAPEVVALDEALVSLERIDPRKALIVELRFFGGLRLEEIAECLGVAPITVSRQWRRARAWLYHELAEGEQGCGGEHGGVRPAPAE